MKIAIPCEDKVLCAHFGHCEAFAILDVDMDSKKMGEVEYVTPPHHEPDVLPKWLAEKQVNLVIAGGMGSRAQQLFGGQGIQVLVGSEAGSPEKVVTNYLDGSLQSGGNLCDH
ncbi:MAG: ATPase [Spirochaetaceae bacterium 4572_59]|nr:MAG: ATPase [Spirochaetaceae bacterium 4572_59]